MHHIRSKIGGLRENQSQQNFGRRQKSLTIADENGAVIKKRGTKSHMSNSVKSRICTNASMVDNASIIG
jgi:hypothetical protein